MLWGERGVVGANAESPLEVWRRAAADPDLVTGEALAGAGHFLVDEQPAATTAAVRAFLGG